MLSLDLQQVFWNSFRTCLVENLPSGVPILLPEESEDLTLVSSLERPSSDMEEPETIPVSSMEKRKEDVTPFLQEETQDISSIGISHVFWICLLFFLLSFLIVLLLWIGLAYLFVVYLVIRKFGSLNSQPTPSGFSENPSIHV